MHELSVIVWDLETVPDLEAAARMLDMQDGPAVEIRAALGNEFPKHPLHRIVCIGALVGTRDPEGWRIRALGAPHIGDRTEAQLITAFAEKIAALHPQLVTWNGNSFDLPVLRYRAMVNRVSAPGLSVRPYFHRYTEDAVDLCDVLTSYSANSRIKLDQLSKILGLPGKPDGMDGSRVEELVDAGRLAEVARYCEGDVLNTYHIWLRYLFFRGAITPVQFEWSEAQAADFCNGRDRIAVAAKVGALA